MKTKNLSVVSFCLIVTVLVACRKEYKSFFSESQSNNLKWAKDHFNNSLLTNTGNLVIYKKLNSNIATGALANKVKNIKTPNWFRANEGKTFRYDFVEVPLRYTKKLSRSVGTSVSKDKKLLQASFDRLIIYKDKEGKISERIVSYIPDRDYLLKHKGDISHNKINKLDKDFNGYLRYSSWDGTPLFMLRITNGKATKMAFSPIDDLSSIPNILGQKRINAKGKLANNYEDCTFIIEYVYEQTCYFDSPEDTEPAYCDEPMVISETIVDMVCPSDPGDPCADPANFGNGDCGSEWEQSDDPSAKDSLKKIMKDTCLNASQLETLANMFSQYLNGQGDEDLACAQKAIYNKVLASGKKFGFCIDNSLGSDGAYNPPTKNLFWKDEAGLPVVSLFGHEFFHGFQDTFYTGGTTQYNTGTRTGFPNIEFEQALFYDILNGSSSANAMGSGADVSVKTAYQTWINSITDNNTTYPKQFSDFDGQYYYFLGLFHQNSPYANIGAINTNMQPNALLNIFSSSNCK